MKVETCIPYIRYLEVLAEIQNLERKRGELFQKADALSHEIWVLGDELVRLKAQLPNTEVEATGF